MMIGTVEADHYREKFVFQIEKFVETLEKRLLPTFDGLRTEVDAMSQERTQAYEQSEDIRSWLSPEQAQEAIFESAIEHYDMALSIKQGLHNMFAAGLFHLFEQQVQEFHVKALYQQRMRFAHEVLEMWNAHLKIDVLNAKVRHDLDELRELANTVKHGDGRAAKVLYELNPVLFQNEWDRDLPPDFGVIAHKPPVFAPMYGEDIYVQLTDIHRYRDALATVWSAYLSAFVQHK